MRLRNDFGYVCGDATTGAANAPKMRSANSAFLDKVTSASYRPWNIQE
jgi:hypothetical protein